MASENMETSAGNDEDTGPASEPNEHDYANIVSGNVTLITSAEASSSSSHPATNEGVTAQSSGPTPAQLEPSETVQPTDIAAAELPEPAVGAEVDCPGDNDAGSASPPEQSGETLLKNKSFNSTESASSTGGPRRGRQRTQRPEDLNCCCCKCQFERHGRSFNRRAVFTFTTPETVQWAFPDAVVNDKSFLCETCAQVIRSKSKRKQSGKRSLWLKPPPPKQVDAKAKKNKVCRMGKKSKAAQLVSKSCYKSALKMLWSAKGARKPMMEFWSKLIREEMKALSRQADSPFHQKVSSRKPLSSFPWQRCLDWAQDKAPLVTTCLRSLFPDINALTKSSHQVSEDQAQMLLGRRAVVTLSIPLFTRNIWKNNFLQAALGAELRLQGCSGSALDSLNTMGLCQNKDTVRLLLHRLQSSKKIATQNGQQRLKLKTGLPADVDEDAEEDEEEEEEMEDEVEEEEVQEEDEEEEDPAAEEKEEKDKKRKKKKAKKQRKRKEERRKERGKRKAKEREEEEESEEEDEGAEPKKRRVVVVRLGLLKGHSEVGRSDLSAP
ncbi:hypothetical protein LDENG_00115510 [Lucifuga dentata]|nr:hypothetical protein LDENG_00115510 [Lucifuga dentata]